MNNKTVIEFVFRIIWRHMEISEGVRPRRITPSSISTILIRGRPFWRGGGGSMGDLVCVRFFFPKPWVIFLTYNDVRFFPSIIHHETFVFFQRGNFFSPGISFKNFFPSKSVCRIFFFWNHPYPPQKSNGQPLKTYPVFLNPSSISAIDDINKAQRVGHVLYNEFIRHLTFSYSWAVHYHDLLLKWIRNAPVRFCE